MLDGWTTILIAHSLFLMQQRNSHRDRKTVHRRESEDDATMQLWSDPNEMRHSCRRRFNWISKQQLCIAWFARIVECFNHFHSRNASTKSCCNFFFSLFELWQRHAYDSSISLRLASINPHTDAAHRWFFFSTLLVRPDNNYRKCENQPKKRKKWRCDGCEKSSMKNDFDRTLIMPTCFTWHRECKHTRELR